MAALPNQKFKLAAQRSEVSELPFNLGEMLARDDIDRLERLVFVIGERQQART